MVRVKCPKCGSVTRLDAELSADALALCGRCGTTYSYAVGRALYEADERPDPAGPRTRRDAAMLRTTCPKCGSVLELTDDMVNQQIECGNCQAVFVAKPDGPPPSRRGADEDRPSRRGRPDDEDDRPSRRRRDDDDDDRPSRRRDRFEDDDDRPRRRRRRPEGGGQGLAITSLVLGILSLPLAFCCGLFSIPISAIGAILGVVHLAQGKSEGKGMAIGGIALSAIGLILMIIFVVAGLAFNLANIGNKQNNNPPFGPQPQNKRPFGR